MRASFAAPDRPLLFLSPPSGSFTESDGVVTWSFLSESHSYAVDQIDWHDPKVSRLWRYNLHYFDYLLSVPPSALTNDWVLQSAVKEAALEQAKNHSLIRSWIRDNPQGTSDGWEPYTASLRIVNWLKWLCANRSRASAEVVASVALQTEWLSRNVEYHILANHLMKNGKALFFAGALVRCSASERWRRLGLKILKEQFEEQFLGDGAHYERSPQYHAICLEDILDCLSLIQAVDGLVDDATVSRWHEIAISALAFSQAMTHPDGRIALFNDSAFDIAPSAEALGTFATALGLPVHKSAESFGLEEYACAGYYVFRDAELTKLIFDCGEIGPDYQPGHGHCDSLSFEYSLNGRRVFVDTGVFDYVASSMRAYARSTAAHNTAMIDGVEQSEIWGVFRVGRRARPTSVKVRVTGHDSVSVEAGHDGFTSLFGSPFHRRRLDWTRGGGFRVRDDFEGRGCHQVTTWFHLHPALGWREVVRESSKRMYEVVDEWGRIFGKLEARGPSEYSIDRTEWYPRFGQRQARESLSCRASGELPVTFDFAFSPADNAEI